MNEVVLVKRSKYKKNAWCTFCGEYIPYDELTTDKCGRLKCQYCGHVVRTKPRKKNHRFKSITVETTPII